MGRCKFEGRQILIDLRPTICVAPARSKYCSRQGSAAAASTTTAVLALPPPPPPTRASQAHCRPATIYNRRLTKNHFWVRRFGGGGTRGSRHSPDAAVQPAMAHQKESKIQLYFVDSQLQYFSSTCVFQSVGYHLGILPGFNEGCRYVGSYLCTGSAPAPLPEKERAKRTTPTVGCAARPVYCVQTLQSPNIIANLGKLQFCSWGPHGVPQLEYITRFP